MIFSILTATYNRAHTLPKVYASLKKQTLGFDKFEWLIMDDGSSDSTDALVQSWIHEGIVNIGYYKQKNGGHHRALNGIIPKAKGKFSIILDSDDTLTPNGLERFLYHWETIPEDKRHEFAGISALCQSETGELIGKPIPGGTLDTNNMEVMYIYELGGDRKGSILTEIQQAYLYPEFEGEKFITDSIVWHKMGRKYKYRYVDETLCITDYLEDGQTVHSMRLMCTNAQGSTAYYRNILDDPTRLPLRVRAGLHAYYVRYALHAGYSWSKIIKEGSKRPLHMLIGLLAGPLFYLRDELIDAKQVRKKKSLKLSLPVKRLPS
jgi:glycosyltransferase involved in cell wall biosynthesis